ncbi:NADH-quinone oxidoreductase subunit C [Streptomyces sp. NPDC059063]|uniref:NADH-quinone oxidoreductase subunit C n=1 Tax=unclassified Streptomyces TaxID=2593676 RepID=UPI0036C76E1B
MTTGWLPSPVEELFGTDATAEESYEVLTVDVPAASWTDALRTARSVLGCTYFDWLSAVDEPGTGFRVSAHVVALAPVRRLLVRTTVPHEAPALPTAVDVYAGAAWHERETHEMFGVHFEGHPGLTPLLLPEGFEGHPLRKDFVLAARVAKAWPGAKEPGESEHGGPKRRQMLPPGVPDPNEWGPLKGQLPAAPARPARGAARTAPGERPARRTRTAGEGSASQTEATPARRTRSASQGSASQRPATTGSPEGAAPAAGTAPVSGAAPAAGEAAPAAPAPPRRNRSASAGSASQRAAEPAPTEAKPPRREGSADAPWHHARPAFDTQEPTAEAAKAPEAAEAPEGSEAAEAAAKASEAPEAAEGSESSTPPAASSPPADATPPEDDTDRPGGPQ